MAASLDPSTSVVLSGLATGSVLFVFGSAVTAHYQRNPWKLPIKEWLEWRLVPAALYAALISFLLSLAGWYAAAPLRFLLSKTPIFPVPPVIVTWLLLVAFASATPYLFQSVTRRLWHPDRQGPLLDSLEEVVRPHWIARKSQEIVEFTTLLFSDAISEAAGRARVRLLRGATVEATSAVFSAHLDAIVESSRKRLPMEERARAENIRRVRNPMTQMSYLLAHLGYRTLREELAAEVAQTQPAPPP